MLKRIFERDSGGAAVLYAMLSPIVCLCAALTVDVGTFYLQKRALQGATDLAAIAAAQNPSNALVAAQQNLIVNGFPAVAVKNVEFGTYAPNSTASPSQWFTPGQGSAVQVSTQIQAPFYFATILNFLSASPCVATTCDTATITATATATFEPQAAFTVASGLANLNGGVLNSVFGALLGSNLSLSLMDYQSLASADIDLFTFSNALASRMNVTAGTYSDLAEMQVSEPVVLQALADAAGANSSATVVGDLNALANLAPSSPTFALGQLVSFGEYGSLQINSAAPITVAVDALDMLSGVAAVGNGQHQVQTSFAVNAAPVVSAKLALTIGEMPEGSGFVAIGSTGATVHTAQTRLLLTLRVAQTDGSATINLPIYIELASATATLTAISCSTDPTQQSATLAVTPAVVNAWIGEVNSAEMTDFATEPSPPAASLLNVAGIQISGRANATISNVSSTPVTFAYSDIVNDTRKTTSTTDFTQSLLNDLLGTLQLSASVGGVNVSVPSALSTAVATSLDVAAAPIDQTITQILDALGLSLGNAYTWVSGVKCGSARLVL